MSRNVQTRLLQQTVKQAVSVHKSGKLDDAERRYRAVLRQQPDNPDALHFLGLLLHRRGDTAAGTESVRRATMAAPGYADAFNSLTIRAATLTFTNLHRIAVLSAVLSTTRAYRRRPAETPDASSVAIHA